MRATIHWVVGAVLLGCLGLTVAGLLLTGGSSASPFAKRPVATKDAATPHVDESPFASARALAATATTSDERTTAEEAMRLADSEIDLAFSMALRDAPRHSAPPTAKARRLQAWVKRAQGRANSDQDQVARLTKLAAAAHGPQQAALQQQLELAQAQLSLDQDELSDAQRDLAREGGDAEARLKQMLDEYAKTADPVLSSYLQSPPAAGQTGNSSGASSGAASRASSHSLIVRVEEWSQARGERDLVAEARADTLARAAVLGRQHDALEQQVRAQQPQAPAAVPPGPARAKPAAANTAALAALQQLKLDQQDLSDLDRRFALEQELGDVYARWTGLAAGVERNALHGLIQSLFWIFLLLFLAVVAELVATRLFSRLFVDRKRLHIIQSIIRYGIRGLTAVLILIVIFGPPSQLGTILALAGAGLTVALKDFIVAFIGWFVLIGKNGMRPGDWVEINGVQGKVLEVGLLFTVVLETGNWTDAGHPTGRKVRFINSFAIEGYYFNFSTTGQWLWDEIQIGLPAATDPYPVLTSLQEVATRETQSNAKLAEREWQRAMAGSGLNPFSAEPVITVRPTGGGLTVVLRYIARADEREGLRVRLYRAAFDLLVGPVRPVDSPSQPADETARA